MEVELVEGIKVLIDEEDYEKIKKYKWWPCKTEREGVYRFQSRRKDGRNITLNAIIFGDKKNRRPRNENPYDFRKFNRIIGRDSRNNHR